MNRSSITIFLAAFVGATMFVLIAVEPARADAGTDMVEHHYAASADTFANPERGYYRYSETHFAADGKGQQPLDAAGLTESRVRDGVTLVFRYFYLDRYRDEDVISPADLGSIRADLATARAAGVKLILRFAYTGESSADAPEARVIGHIVQLAPVLNENADVVAALQAGFVGRWGEWYYSDNFASDAGKPWQLTEENWAARSAVLLTLLKVTSARIPVQVRYPGIKQRIFPDPDDPRAARVGIHNDCFLASADDYGTFVTDDDRGWLAEQTRHVLMGGETCASNSPRSDWPAASDDLAAYHWTYLNADYRTDVLASWGAAGLAETKRRLGYRLRLTSATMPGDARPGEPARVTLTLTNDGYAAPAKRRPVQLILRDGADRLVVPIAADPRDWAPGETVELAVTFDAPQRAGGYALYLNLPDSAPGLSGSGSLVGGAGSLNAAYAVRLANEDVWDAGRGWNSLGATLLVSAG